MQSPKEETGEPPSAQWVQERVTVAVRVRPLNPAEEEYREKHNKGLAVVFYSKERQVSVPPFAVQDTIRANISESIHRKVVSDSSHSHRVASVFQFDHVFWSVEGVKDASGADPVGQQEVYQEIGKPLVDHAFEGFNGCLFAYGQTGSGKTYTMMGSDVSSIAGNPETGIIPRICNEIFLRKEAADREGCSTWSVEIGYVEVYNEKVTDLLARRRRGMEDEDVLLDVKENPVKGVYLEGQKFVVVSSVEDVLNTVQKGNMLRRTAATKMNTRSSRSHAILMIYLKEQRVMTTKKGMDIKTSGLTSKLNLVDLAGSERPAKSEIEGDKLAEAIHINLSLTTLGRIIDILSDKKSTTSFVPFRDSKLTHILKESLKGNSKTCMIATVSPSLMNANETLSTLHYASRAREIVNSVRANENEKARRIRELEEEVKNLKNVLQKNEPLSNMEEVEELRNRILLLSSEAESRAAEFQLFEKERESEKKKIELLNASEAERKKIEEEARRLKEEVDRYSIQADTIADENAQLKEEMENLRQQVRANQEERRNTCNEDEQQHLEAMKKQLSEVEQQLQIEKNERRSAEEAVRLAHSRLRDALSQSLRGNDKSKVLLEENKSLEERMNSLLQDMQNLRAEKEQLALAHIDNNWLRNQNQMVIIQLEEMEKRYHGTIFFLLSRAEQKGKWEERHIRRLEIEHEAQMEEIMMKSRMDVESINESNAELNRKLLQSIEDKKAYRDEVEQLHTEIYSLRLQASEQQNAFQKLHDEYEKENSNLKSSIDAMEINIKEKEKECGELRRELCKSNFDNYELKIRIKALRDKIS